MGHNVRHVCRRWLGCIERWQVYIVSQWWSPSKILQIIWNWLGNFCYCCCCCWWCYRIELPGSVCCVTDDNEILFFFSGSLVKLSMAENNLVHFRSFNLFLIKHVRSRVKLIAFSEFCVVKKYISFFSTNISNADIFPWEKLRLSSQWVNGTMCKYYSV